MPDSLALLSNPLWILTVLGAVVPSALEALTGDRDGQFSVRINQQFRICFEWTDRGPRRVEIVDYH